MKSSQQQQINELKQTLVESLRKLAELEEQISNTDQSNLWRTIKNQTEFYNGHGQLTVSEISLKELMDTCRKLTENEETGENIYYLALHPENDNTYSGSIYQSISGDADVLWFSAENITGVCSDE